MVPIAAGMKVIVAKYVKTELDIAAGARIAKVEIAMPPRKAEITRALGRLLASI